MWTGLTRAFSVQNTFTPTNPLFVSDEFNGEGCGHGHKAVTMSR